MTNPFQKNYDDGSKNIVNDIADVLKQNRANAEKLPDYLVTAAQAAGAEARGSNARTTETRSGIYKKHFTNAIGDKPQSSGARQEFERIADQEASSHDEI